MGGIQVECRGSESENRRNESNLLTPSFVLAGMRVEPESGRLRVSLRGTEPVPRPSSPTLAHVFEREYAALLRLSVLLSGDPHSAEDIVQEAFVRVSSKLDRLGEEELRPYLRRIVINLWKNRTRRQSLERRIISLLPERRSVPSFEEQMADRDRLWSALGQMPPRQRACIVLRFYEDLPERAIADAVGCSIGTVKSQLSRGLSRLGEELGGSGS